MKINSIEFTIQEAADLLNVSPSFLIKQIEAGEIPDRNPGKHRRIHFNDIMIDRERNDRATSQALDEIIAISEELGLYDLRNN
ncbi:MAG: helix-turn-helix domain-containing protein [Microcoleus sp. SU_5_3]|nr:helix-turn-helix domain-containing protein [Microcoleus sp. SU_5_3]NJL69502.1 helix-turn-helix domain-containing protein [Microcoleus sp. SM1_3_4]